MGGKHSTSTSTVSIPKEVLARYNAVNARAETAASKPWTSYGNTASDYVAQMNAQQNAGINDINATAGSYQPYMTQATQATQAGMGPAYAGIENYMSPYIKNVADTTGAYMRQQQEQAQSGALGTAAMSGAFGGDRAGIAAANLQQQNQMGYGKTMADIMNQGYTQALGASQADLARQLQGGAQMAGLGAQSQQLGLQGAQAKIAAGTMQQQTEQAGKDAMIQRFMQEQGYPFQTAQFLANIAMGTGANSGSTTTSTTPLGIFGNLATGGRVGGYADGGGVAGPRTYSQGTIGGEGYVPVGDLPIGQLMVAQPPQQQSNGNEEMLALITKAMGAAHGGAIDQRHGYATDGGVHDYSTEALRRDIAFRNLDPEYPEDQRKQQLANISAAIGRTATNPANMGLSGYTMPAPTTTGVVPVEAKAQPERFGQPEPASIDNLGEQMRKTPPFLRYNYQKAQFGRNLGAHAPAESTPTADMAGSFAAGEPRASERYMLPTGLNPAADYEAATAFGLPPGPPPVEGLGAAGTTPPVNTTVSGPAALPAGGVGGADVAADAMRTIRVTPTALDMLNAQPATLGSQQKPASDVDPVEFFNTKIIGQESGDNQFDKNGNPLTSSAGAVGAAQVTEGTGPEAARLAGVDWDRNRWLNDKEYNKALGRAYFLEQYRQFGSLDKAAAAYNAGPGALARAMDRARALGGSYLDYLPDETKNYVYSTTGMGSGAKADDGLGGADMTAGQQAPSGGVKPYEDRNMIGKFFHNPDGSISNNAVMSLLSGLGTMAATNTISPISAILQGIAGGNATYKELLKQTPEVVAKNLENIKEISRGAMAWNAMPNHTPVTPAEYARMVGMPMDAATQKLLEGMGAGAATGGENYLGAPLNPYGTGMTENVTRPDGAVVKAYNDIGYLQRLLAKQQPLVFAGVLDPSSMTETQNRITAIQNNGGRVPLEDGSGGYVVDPIYAEGQAAAVDTTRGSDLQQKLPDLKNAADTATTTVNQLGSSISAAVATGETGALSKLYSKGSSFWEAVGGGSGNYAALDEEVKKSLAEFLRQKTGDDSTDYQTSIAQGALPDLAKQPAANAWVLATMQAQADRENARVDAISKAATPQEAAANERNITNNFPLEERTRQHYEENLKKFGVPDPTKIDISAATTIGPNGVVPPNLVGTISQDQWNAAKPEDVAVLLGGAQVKPNSTVDTLPEVNNPMGN